MSMRIFFKKASVAICSCVLGSSSCSVMGMLRSTVRSQMPNVPEGTDFREMFRGTNHREIKLDNFGIHITGKDVKIGLPQLTKFKEIPDQFVENAKELVAFDVDLPDVKKIGCRTFAFCINLPEVDFSKTSIVRIEKLAFTFCQSLTKVIVPLTLTSIGDNAFAGCTKLKDVSNLDNVTSIGKGAFRGCVNLNKDLADKLRSKFGNDIF